MSDAKGAISKSSIIVRVGNIVVRIHASESRGYRFYQVADYSSGRRRLLTFRDEDVARRKAKEIAHKMANGQVDVLQLSSDDRASYARAIQLLKPSGVSLELAAAEYAHAKRLLHGRGLAEAVDFYLLHKPNELPDKTVEEVVSELIKAKKADGASEVYVKDLNFRLGRLKKSIQGLLKNLTVQDLNKFLRSQDCGGRGRNNYRRTIGTLIRFAESAGYLIKNGIDVAKLARAKEEHAEIDIFTEAEITKLLAASRLDPDSLAPGYNRRYATGSGLLPFLLLGAFAGLRTAEIERQRWDDINLDRGFIRVTAAKGNTAQKRLVPLCDNLKKWLELVRRDTGPVCEIARTSDALKRLASRAEVPWKHNALRHSYASYRLAVVKNVAQVSLEMGNTPKMVFKHYRELVAEEDGIAWFAITPPGDAPKQPECRST